MSSDDTSDDEIFGGGIDEAPDGEHEARWVVRCQTPMDVDSVHPDCWEVRDGVDYVAGWREGQRLASELRACCERLGIGAGVQFAPGVSADDSAIVSVSLAAWAAARLADLLSSSRERQEAQPPIRGPDDRVA